MSDLQIRLVMFHGSRASTNIDNCKIKELQRDKTKQNDMCAQRRLGSACASAQSDQSSLCAHWVAKDPTFLHADSERADAQADLSLGCAHMSFCRFCHAVAYQLFILSIDIFACVLFRINYPVMLIPGTVKSIDT